MEAKGRRRKGKGERLTVEGGRLKAKHPNIAVLPYPHLEPEHGKVKTG